MSEFTWAQLQQPQAGLEWTQDNTCVKGRACKFSFFGIMTFTEQLIAFQVAWPLRASSDGLNGGKPQHSATGVIVARDFKEF